MTKNWLSLFRVLIAFLCFHIVGLTASKAEDEKTVLSSEWSDITIVCTDWDVVSSISDEKPELLSFLQRHNEKSSPDVYDKVIDYSGELLPISSDQQLKTHPAEVAEQLTLAKNFAVWADRVANPFTKPDYQVVVGMDFASYKPVKNNKIPDLSGLIASVKLNDSDGKTKDVSFKIPVKDRKEWQIAFDTGKGQRAAAAVSIAAIASTLENIECAPQNFRAIVPNSDIEFWESQKLSNQIKLVKGEDVPLNELWVLEENDVVKTTQGIRKAKRFVVAK